MSANTYHVWRITAQSMDYLGKVDASSESAALVNLEDTSFAVHYACDEAQHAAMLKEKREATA